MRRFATRAAWLRPKSGELGPAPRSIRGVRALGMRPVTGKTDDSARLPLTGSSTLLRSPLLNKCATAKAPPEWCSAPVEGLHQWTRCFLAVASAPLTKALSACSAPATKTPLVASVSLTDSADVDGAAACGGNDDGGGGAQRNNQQMMAVLRQDTRQCVAEVRLDRDDES